MSYEYRPTVAERRAAELLRSMGWGVSEPSCPICHGWGAVPRYETRKLTEVMNEPDVWSSTLSQDACPNGCTFGGFYFPTTTAAMVP